MKILVVSYLPSLEASRTRRLLDAFFEVVSHKKGIERLDLLQDYPNFITPDILHAYVARNYNGKVLSAEQKQHIAIFDRMTTQFKAADLVVMAFPMYNFSIPGVIKAYFDSVMLKGETFDIGKNGFVGLMKGKRALILFSSGGDYTGKHSGYDHLTGLVRAEFEFMGFEDIRFVSAQGVDMKSRDTEAIITAARKQVVAVMKDWGL